MERIMKQIYLIPKQQCETLLASETLRLLQLEREANESFNLFMRQKSIIEQNIRILVSKKQWLKEKE